MNVINKITERNTELAVGDLIIYNGHTCILVKHCDKYLAVSLKSGQVLEYNYHIESFINDDDVKFINDNQYSASLTIDYPVTQACEESPF